MCRLLAVKSAVPFAFADFLGPFARIARESREWQGDGWGFAAWRDGRWERYRTLRPVWEDGLAGFGRGAFLLAHARSAFRNEGIDVENNMPFVAGSSAFVFNGELHGVRARVPGRIGAERIFNFLRRLGGHTSGPLFTRATAVLRKRTGYVKALNLVLAEGTTLFIHSAFGEDADYFTLHRRTGDGRLAVCSMPFPGEAGWQALSNPFLEVDP